MQNHAPTTTYSVKKAEALVADVVIHSSLSPLSLLFRTNGVTDDEAGMNRMVNPLVASIRWTALRSNYISTRTVDLIDIMRTTERDTNFGTLDDTHQHRVVETFGE